MKHGLRHAPEQNAGGDGRAQSDGEPVPAVEDRLGVRSANAHRPQRRQHHPRHKRHRRERRIAEQPVKAGQNPLIGAGNDRVESVEIHKRKGERREQQNDRRPENQRAGGFDGFSKNGGRPPEIASPQS